MSTIIVIALRNHCSKILWKWLGVLKQLFLLKRMITFENWEIDENWLKFWQDSTHGQIHLGEKRDQTDFFFRKDLRYGKSRLVAKSCFFYFSRLPVIRISKGDKYLVRITGSLNNWINSFSHQIFNLTLMGWTFQNFNEREGPNYREVEIVLLKTNPKTQK